MARRPVFIPDPRGSSLVRTQLVDFQWHPGLAVSQKQKSVASLHAAAIDQCAVDRVLEISSKSENPLGIALSAFNLTLGVAWLAHPLRVECAFQGSKVFDQGGPFTDLFNASSRDAKRDDRIKASGNLRKFHFDGHDWALAPPTAFYDWLYISALKAHPDLASRLQDYQAFTDIEFNPEKSINCQAYSVALYRALQMEGSLDRATVSPDTFLAIVRSRRTMNVWPDQTVQGSLF